MSEFFRDWFVWCYLYLQHVFVMMYWVTIPGLLVCGFLSVRYRGMFEQRLLSDGGSVRRAFYALARAPLIWNRLVGRGQGNRSDF